LDLFPSYLLLTLLRLLLLPLLVPSPSPLHLDGSDMVHSKPVVLEQSPSQSHLISSLDKCCTEVLPALLFSLMEHIERRCEELGSELLSGSQVKHLADIASLGLLKHPLLLSLRYLLGAALLSLWKTFALPRLSHPLIASDSL